MDEDQCNQECCQVNTSIIATLISYIPYDLACLIDEYIDESGDIMFTLFYGRMYGISVQNIDFDYDEREHRHIYDDEREHRHLFRSITNSFGQVLMPACITCVDQGQFPHRVVGDETEILRNIDKNIPTPWNLYSAEVEEKTKQNDDNGSGIDFMPGFGEGFRRHNTTGLCVFHLLRHV